MEADVVLDAWGKLVIPGGIDPRDKYGAAVWRDAFGERFFKDAAADCRM